MNPLPFCILLLCGDAVIYAWMGLRWLALLWLGAAVGVALYQRWQVGANAKLPAQRRRVS